MPSGLVMPTRRVVVPRYGDADVLAIDEAQVAAPGDAEVRIQQRAIGVNFIDIYLRRGWVPSMLPVAAGAPGVLGMEAAGTVVDVGHHVNGLLPGDRVAYLARYQAPIAAAQRAGRLGGSAAGRSVGRRGRGPVAQGADGRLSAA
jgi:NADPH:quinone reductase-like Zn-dependent oxidoreductase